MGLSRTWTAPGVPSLQGTQMNLGKYWGLSYAPLSEETVSWISKQY